MAFLEVFEMNKVTVKIANQEYTVVGEESKEYLLKIASRVDDEMEDLLLNNPKFNYSACAVLTAINITDELCKQKEELDQLKEKCNSLEEYKIKLESLLDQKESYIQNLNNHLEELQEDNSHVKEIKYEFENAMREKEAQLMEAIALSNQFQNRMFQLQIEIEELNKKLK